LLSCLVGEDRNIETVSAVETYADQAVALVFGDSAAARSRGEAAAIEKGWRLGCSLGLSEAMDRLDLQSRIDVLLVELEGPCPAGLGPLLERIERDTGEARYPAIISFPLEAIDTVSASISSSGVTLLCNPDTEQRVAALDLACDNRRPGLRDWPREDRLREFGEEVCRVAQSLSMLGKLAQDCWTSREIAVDQAAAGEPSIAQPPVSANAVRQMIRMRRLRERFLDMAIFGEPGWDMLLDLFAARLEYREVYVSSLCIAAAVPPTTALRWIRAMTEAGMLVRRADPLDKRRVFIELSADTAQRLEAYFFSAQAGALRF